MNGHWPVSSEPTRVYSYSYPTPNEALAVSVSVLRKKKRWSGGCQCQRWNSMLTSMDPSEAPLSCTPFLLSSLSCFVSSSHSLSSYPFFLLHRELARALWDKGLIDFSQVEHVILKSMLLFPFFLSYFLVLFSVCPFTVVQLHVHFGTDFDP